MSKRLILAYPFDRMSGALREKQDLKYPENDDKAFYAPTGKSYANNYKPTMVVRYSAKTGQQSFSIKSKNAVKIDAGAKLRMALLGGTGACRAAILGSAVNRNIVDAIFTAAKAEGRTAAKTLEAYVYDIVYEGLSSKSVMFTFLSSTGSTVNFRNPWVATREQQAGTALTIKSTILVKFWEQLAKNPVIFTVSGMKGVAHSGDTFGEIVLNTPYNVLGMTNGEIPGGSASGIKIGDEFVSYNGTAVEAGDDVVSDRKYDLVTLP